MTDPKPNATELAWRTWQLAAEAGTVIWLRSWVLLLGGSKALREGQLIVDEKVVAALTLWPALIGGGLPASPEALGARALAHYARPVRANRRRLSGRHSPLSSQ